MRNKTRGQLTLARVLEQPSLGLRLATPDTVDLELQVTGAHSFEISRPTRWISPHWIVLTTGMRLKGRPSEQRELIRELKSAGITALGFALDVNFKTVPAAMLDSAIEVELPIFVVPFETRFAEIIAFINQSLIDPNVGALRRFVSVQDHLLDSLLCEDPVDSLIERLAPLVPAEIVLLTARGEVVAKSRDFNLTLLPEILAQFDEGNNAHPFQSPRHEPSQKMDGRKDSLLSLKPLKEFQNATYAGLSIAVDTPNRPVLWLALIQTKREDSAPDGFELSLPLIRSAGHMLSVALETVAQKASARRSSERVLVNELLGLKELRAPSCEETLSTIERLFEFEIDFSEPVFVLHGRSTSAKDDYDLDEQQIFASGAFGSLGFIWDHFEGNFVAIVQGTHNQCEKACLNLVQDFELVIGISDTVSSPDNFKSGFRQAQAASEEALNSSNDVNVLFFKECTMLTWILAQVNSENLNIKQREILAILDNERYAITTLRAYLECNLDIVAAAMELGIHPNSMRYRLSKVRELLGFNLEQLADLVDLYLVLGIKPRKAK